MADRNQLVTGFVNFVKTKPSNELINDESLKTCAFGEYFRFVSRIEPDFSDEGFQMMMRIFFSNAQVFSLIGTFKPIQRTYGDLQEQIAKWK